ncbi:MAG: hypothetical protein WCO50_05960, partial [Synechococcus sp. ELA619]
AYWSGGQSGTDWLNNRYNQNAGSIKSKLKGMIEQGENSLQEYGESSSSFTYKEVEIYKALYDKYFGDGGPGPGGAGPGGPVPFKGGVEWAKEYMKATNWTTADPEAANTNGLLFKNMTAEQAKTKLLKSISENSGEIQKNLQALYDKYFGSGGAAPTFDPVAMFADFKKNFPASILEQSDFSTAEKAKAKLDDLLSGNIPYGQDTIDKLKSIYEKHLGGGGATGGGGPSAPRRPNLPPGLSSFPVPGESAMLDYSVRHDLGLMANKVRADHTVFTDDDLNLMRDPEFQKWFAQAPADYRVVSREFPHIALGDYKEGKGYGWIPKQDPGDIAHIYQLQHFPTTEESGGRFQHPGGDKLHLPNWHSEHYPGHTINPKSTDSARPNDDLKFKPRQPDVPGQLEIPLPGGSSWEPQVEYPTIRRGIDIQWDRYKPGSRDYDKLSLPGEEGHRHRVAAGLLDEIKELMVGTKPFAEQTFPEPTGDYQEFHRLPQPSLFDDEDNPNTLPENMPEVTRRNTTDGWLEIAMWMMKNNLTPEQAWVMAKKAGSDEPEKYGPPPLSYLVAQSKRDPNMLARRLGQLIGDEDYATNFAESKGGLSDISYKLQKVRDDNDYGVNYTPQQQAEASMLYDKWFGEGFLYEVLAHKILDYLEIGGWKPGGYRKHPVPGGLGPHWTTHTRTQFGNSSPGGQGFPVTVVAEWPGSHAHQTGVGEDTDRKDAAWGHHGENEIAINPGTKLIVKQLKFRHPDHPDTSHHIDIDLTPHIRHANFEVPVRKRGRAILSHHERFAAGDGLYYDEDTMSWEVSPPSGKPSSFDTPMFSAQDRPALGDGSYHFSPREINPPSTSSSRPEVYRSERQDTQDPLPDMPSSHYNVPLFRGLAINLHDPHAADIYRNIYGEHPDDEHLFDHDGRPPRYDHPELSGSILDYLEHHRPRQSDKDPIHGLGPHWTLNPVLAHEFALGESLSALNDPGAQYLPVRLKGDWAGPGENPYRDGTQESYDGEFANEDEINLLPGTGLNISDMQIRHPDQRRWISVPHQTQRREANTPLPIRPRNAKRITTQRELMEG